MENENENVELPGKIRVLKYYEKYMFAMGILGQGVFYFQGFKIFQNQSAQDVSFSGFLFGLISVTSWMVYGILIKNKVLVGVNIVAILGALFVLLGICIHGA